MGLVAAFLENSKVALSFAILFSLHTLAITIHFAVTMALADSNIDFIFDVDAEDMDAAKRALRTAKAAVVGLLVIFFILLLAFLVYCAICFFSFANQLKEANKNAKQEVNNNAKQEVDNNANKETTDDIA